MPDDRLRSLSGPSDRVVPVPKRRDCSLRVPQMDQDLSGKPDKALGRLLAVKTELRRVRGKGA